MWREQLGRVRANSAVELLLGLLAGVPVITAESAAGLIARSEMRTGEAINRLLRTASPRHPGYSDPRGAIHSVGWPVTAAMRS